MVKWLTNRITEAAMADRLAVKKYDSIAEAMDDGMVNKPIQHGVALSPQRPQILQSLPGLDSIIQPKPRLSCFYCGRRMSSGEFCKGCGANSPLS